MAKTKVKKQTSECTRRMRPALTPEARQLQLSSLAIDLAEKQLMDGTASSQVITHFLKLATEKEKLEREKLTQENELVRAKTKALKSAESVEKMYKEALNAMKDYSGNGSNDDYE